MTNNTIPNVPRELLADLLGNDHDKRIMAERHLLAMLANAPSPAGVDGLEVIGWYTEDHLYDKSATTYSWTVAERWVEKGWPVSPLYAAPVSEAKAQDVVMPDQEGSDAQIAFWAGFEFAVCGLHNNDIRAAWNDFKSSERFKRLNAAPAAPAADAGLVDALEIAVDYLNSNTLSSIAAGSTCHRKMRAALAAHRAQGVE